MDYGTLIAYKSIDQVVYKIGNVTVIQQKSTGLTFDSRKTDVMGIIKDISNMNRLPDINFPIKMPLKQ